MAKCKALTGSAVKGLVYAFNNCLRIICAVNVCVSKYWTSADNYCSRTLYRIEIIIRRLNERATITRVNIAMTAVARQLYHVTCDVTAGASSSAVVSMHDAVTPTAAFKLVHR